MMRTNDEKTFTREIEMRLASGAWSAAMVASVLARVRRERRSRIGFWSSVLFPALSAALLVAALLGVIAPDSSDSASRSAGRQIAAQSYLDVADIVDNEVDTLIGRAK